MPPSVAGPSAQLEAASARGPPAILAAMSASRPAAGSPPPPDRLQRLLLPIADRFMLVMLSRPPAGTLRDTRVTAASILLAAATFVTSSLAAGWLVRAAGGSGPLALLPLAPLAALAVGSGSLALYGLRQRRR